MARYATLDEIDELAVLMGGGNELLYWHYWAFLNGTEARHRWRPPDPVEVEQVRLDLVAFANYQKKPE